LRFGARFARAVCGFVVRVRVARLFRIMFTHANADAATLPDLVWKRKTDMQAHVEEGTDVVFVSPMHSQYTGYMPP